jgi:hypothetical protein
VNDLAARTTSPHIFETAYAAVNKKYIVSVTWIFETAYAAVK